jgi:tyrosine-protein kinase Etk/Wzc
MEQKYYDEPEESKGFDAKRLFSKLAKGYYWLILSAAICLTAAFLYIRYTVPLYQVSTYIQVQSPSEVTTNILGGSAFGQGGPAAAAQAQPDLNSEIFKLESAALIQQIVDSLHLDIEILTKGRVRDKPLHVDSLPFIVKVKRWDIDEATPLYKLLVSEDGYKIQLEKEIVKGAYFQPLVFKHDTITIEPKPFLTVPKGVYLLRFPGVDGAVAKYSSRVSASAVPKGGMAMLQVSVKDELPERAKQIVEVLLHNYDEANFEHKSKALRTEIEFLENRLATVSGELSTQANKVKDFKSNNRVNDVGTSANQILGNLVTLDSRKSENVFKENLLTQVEASIQQNGQEQIIPNVAALTDPGLSAFVDGYNKLVLRKKEILDRGTPQDIRLPEINAGLANAKSSIYSSLNSIRQQLRTANALIVSQEQSQTGRFQGMAEKEKDLNQTNRVLGVKDALYTFLQQKIEDKKMEYASAGIAGSRIIDWNISKSVNPKPYMVYAIGFILGIMIPVLVIVVQFMLNNKIETREDIHGITALPIAGEIILDNSKADVVIAEETVSPIAEQFRTLRTNISYMGYGPDHKVLMVTSSVSGEGKSFVSLNLASSLAISSKKVILLEFDLRNPSLSERLGFKKSPGITNFLRGEGQVDDLVQAVPEMENLAFLSAGTPLPLNPGEIILNPRMKLLFDYLRAHYDYIVMDTPPVEAVSDALSLGKLADISFFVLRHKYTLRPSIKLINQLHVDQKLPHISLIINGIKPGYGFQHVYGYGYEYGQMGKGKKKKKSSDAKLKIA